MTKLDFTLIPLEFEDLALVAMNGAKKYEPHGWEKGFDKEQNLASIKRHLNDYRSGNMADSESKLHPLLHAAFRAMMQYTLDKRASNTDELFKIASEFEAITKRIDNNYKTINRTNDQSKKPSELVKSLNNNTNFKWKIHSGQYDTDYKVNEFKTVKGCSVYWPKGLTDTESLADHDIGCICLSCETHFWGK
jgi:hypothetical protein